MFYRDLKLGILGGGQLGRMLLQPCANLNVTTHVLDPNPEAPCSQLAHQFQTGSFKDFDTVYNFGKQVEVLTIEIEHVNVDALEKLEQEGVLVYPQSRVVRMIQDKRLQKQFYLDHGIPSADFILVEDPADARAKAGFLPAFQKVGKGGYDGYGVQFIESKADLDKCYDAPSLFEKPVDFDKEISVIVARNTEGEIKAFPPVEMVADPALNLVDYLLAPADIRKEVAERAEAIAQQVIEAFDMVGILAVELFLTQDGDLLVNEVAPRPHNSGHQSINANHTSQYEQHLRAILGLSLGEPGMKCPAAMVNLLGAEGAIGAAVYEGIEDVLAIPGTNVFLYGKTTTKPGRKMGHVTILDEDVVALKEKVKQVKQLVKVTA